MDPSDTDYDPDPERETNSDGESDRLKEEAAAHEKPVSQLDFYQADPFTHGDRMYHKFMYQHQEKKKSIFKLKTPWSFSQ